MPFFHAEDAVQAQLLFSAFNHGRKYTDNHYAQFHDSFHVIRAAHLLQPLIIGNGHINIRGHISAKAGQKIREVSLAVF